MSITATTTTCFLKSSSPPPHTLNNHKPGNPPAKHSQIIPRQSDRPMAIRSVSGLACVFMIGFEFSNPIQSIFSNNHNLALAQQLQTPAPKSSEKWSDKRSCPAWELNALETIVPENLPRPSAKRRWEIVGFKSREAPAIFRIRVFGRGSGCFTM